MFPDECNGWPRECNGCVQVSVTAGQVKCNGCPSECNGCIQVSVMGGQVSVTDVSRWSVMGVSR